MSAHPFRDGILGLAIGDALGTPAIPLMIALARWGAEHCDYVIVEGILDAEVYEPLFRALAEIFHRVYAYYYDLPFEETLLRHQTKPNRNDFGEADMRRWWKEKDFIGWLPETPIGSGVTLGTALEKILSDVNRDLLR